jgi:hypothetical protein
MTTNEGFKFRVGDKVKTKAGDTMIVKQNAYPEARSLLLETPAEVEPYIVGWYAVDTLTKGRSSRKAEKPADATPPAGQPYNVTFESDNDAGEVVVHVSAAASEDEAIAIARTQDDGSYEQLDVVGVDLIQPPA